MKLIRVTRQAPWGVTLPYSQWSRKKLTSARRLSTSSSRSNMVLSNSRSSTVDGPQVLDSPHGIDRLFREFHAPHTVAERQVAQDRRDNRSEWNGGEHPRDGPPHRGCRERLASAETTPAPTAGECRGIEAFAHEAVLGLNVVFSANCSHRTFCSGVRCGGTWMDTIAYRSPRVPSPAGNPFPRKRNCLFRHCARRDFQGHGSIKSWNLDGGAQHRFPRRQIQIVIQVGTTHTGNRGAWRISRANRDYPDRPRRRLPGLCRRDG